MRGNILAIFVFLWANFLLAAPFRNMPAKVLQPDGSSLNLLSSGDEFFNYLHDEKGYTVIQNPETGWVCYAILESEELKSSNLIYGESDPYKAGISPYNLISYKKYQERRRLTSKNYKSKNNRSCPSQGTVNSVNIYIRFSDQSEFTDPRSISDSLFNGSWYSFKKYFDEVSYHQLIVYSHHYPECDMNQNLSYQDSHPRAYYSPYNTVTNPIGYQNNDQRTEREHSLLANAVSYISEEVPEELLIDSDNDNFVDNICFIIQGENDNWAELLWPHRWWLDSQNVILNGKQVYDYTFLLYNPLFDTNGFRPICHEFFHSLGAPDLYHYNYWFLISCGPWDIMDAGSSHPTAFMKWKYGRWIQDIPLIESSQLVTLNPLLMGQNNCVRIKSPNSETEYFVIEYRKAEMSTFEFNIPGDGLIISRINPDAGEGNADGPPDEEYIYRLWGAHESTGFIGDIYQAFFSTQSGRTFFNDNSDPSCFLSDNSHGGINISNIGFAGETIHFQVNVSSQNQDVQSLFKNVKIFPNPFNPETTIKWNQTKKSQVQISLYNVKGRKISTLYNDVNPAGEHSFVFNSSNQKKYSLSSGIYLLKISLDDTIITKKIILLK